MHLQTWLHRGQPSGYNTTRIMTELLWVALGLVAGVLAGYFIPRNQQPRVQHSDEALALRGQLGKSRSEVEDAKLELARVAQTKESLEAQLKELQARMPRLEGFERANADLRLQLKGFDAVTQERDAAKADLAAAKPRIAEFESLSARLEAAQAELSGLKTKTSGFEGLQQKAAQSAELEQKTASLEADKVRLLKEANDAALKASDAEAAQKKLRAALDESIAEVARVKDGMRQFEGLKARIDDLEARGLSPETQARLEGLQRDLEAAQARAASLEADAGARQQLQQTQLRVLDLERQLASLPAQREEWQAKIQTLEGALRESQAELERRGASTEPQS